MRSNIVVIDSRYRKNPDTTVSSNFRINFNYPIWARGFTIKQLIIPNTEYNVDEKNNVFSYFYNSAPQAITIPVGQYTLTDLLGFLQSGVQTTTGDDTITFSQDPFTKKVVISSPTQTITLNNDPNLTNLVAPFLGFPQSVNVSGNTLIGSLLPKLTGTLNFYLTSNTLSQGTSGYLGNGIEVPLVCACPMDRAAYGQYAFIEQDHPTLNTYMFDRDVNLQNIDIRLVNFENEEVDLKGLPITIILRTHESDSVISKAHK